jgi:hypothetical protein
VAQAFRLTWFTPWGFELRAGAIARLQQRLTSDKKIEARECPIFIAVRVLISPFWLPAFIRRKDARNAESS